MFFPLSRSSESDDCRETDSCQSLDNPDFIALIVFVSILGLALLCACIVICVICYYDNRRFRRNRAVSQLPEVPILEHVVNVEPPPAITFHIESTEQLQPVQNGERITIVVD